MPYITFPTMPDSIGVGRSAQNVSYEHDTLAHWVGEVDAVQDGETEIDEATFTAQAAANTAHNDALPAPPAPAPLPDGNGFKAAAMAALGAAAMQPPLLGFVTFAIDAVNQRDWTLLRTLIEQALAASALTQEQHDQLTALLTTYHIPES